MDTAVPQEHSPLQVVVFTLEGKSLALNIESVQEILRMVEITPMPNMPPFVLGVINLRGKIVPVINIREKLSLPKRKPTAKTCIIIIRSGERTLGLLVDDVAEVMALPFDALEKSESDSEWVHSELFLGVGKLPGRLLVILDGHRLLSPKEVVQLQQAGNVPLPFQD